MALTQREVEAHVNRLFGEDFLDLAGFELSCYPEHAHYDRWLDEQLQHTRYADPDHPQNELWEAAWAYKRLLFEQERGAKPSWNREGLISWEQSYELMETDYQNDPTYRALQDLMEEVLQLDAENVRPRGAAAPGAGAAGAVGGAAGGAMGGLPAPNLNPGVQPGGPQVAPNANPAAHVPPPLGGGAANPGGAPPPGGGAPPGGQQPPGGPPPAGGLGDGVGLNQALAAALHGLLQNMMPPQNNRPKSSLRMTQLKTGSCSALQFSRFENSAMLAQQVNRWSDQELVYHVLGNLHDQAADNARSLSRNAADYASINEFFQKLRERFVTVAHQAVAQSKFATETQRPNESIRAFHSRLRTAWYDAFAREEEPWLI